MFLQVMSSPAETHVHMAGLDGNGHHRNQHMAERGDTRPDPGAPGHPNGQAPATHASGSQILLDTAKRWFHQNENSTSAAAEVTMQACLIDSAQVLCSSI